MKPPGRTAWKVSKMELFLDGLKTKIYGVNLCIQSKYGKNTDQE